MEKENCGNCRFYKDEGSASLKIGYGKCRRFPEAISTDDGKWCGEHSPVQPNPTPAT